MKKVLAVLLAAAMALCLAPIIASAATGTGWIYIVGATGFTSWEDHNEPTWAWNAASATLTLHDGFVANESGIAFDLMSGDVTVIVEGTASTTLLQHNSNGAGKLTITGAGTLNLKDWVYPGGALGYPGGIAAHSLEISGATVNISTAQQNCINLLTLNASSTQFEMTSGTLTMSATGSNKCGISCANSGKVLISGTAKVTTNPSVTGTAIEAPSGSVTINGSAVVDVLSTEGYGIYAGNDIVTIGGSAQVTAETKSSSYSAIAGKSTVISDNATVTAKAPGTPLHGQPLNITGGTVTANGNMAGTLNVSGAGTKVTVNGNAQGTITVNGGEFTLNGKLLYSDNNLKVNGGKVKVTGDVNGTLTVTDGAADVAGKANRLTISGGTADVAGNVNHLALSGGAATVGGAVTDSMDHTGGTLNGNEPDKTPPVLTPGEVYRPSDTQATIYFKANEEGTVYYLVVAGGAAAPTGAQVKSGGTSFGKIQANLSYGRDVVLTAGAKDVYLAAEDINGNLSAALKIAVPAYVPQENNNNNNNNNSGGKKTGIFGTKPQYNQWYHYILFFLCFGFIWMWF